MCRGRFGTVTAAICSRMLKSPSASFSPRKHPQRSREATPAVLSSAAALLTAFLSILRPRPSILSYESSQTASSQFTSARVFITATDTGVGKTLVASALVTRLIQRGIDVGVMKPIETGSRERPRFGQTECSCGNAAGSQDPMAEVCPYTFRLPVVPFSAARAEKDNYADRDDHASVPCSESETCVHGGGRGWWGTCTNYTAT